MIGMSIRDGAKKPCKVSQKDRSLLMISHLKIQNDITVAVCKCTKLKYYIINIKSAYSELKRFLFFGVLF